MTYNVFSGTLNPTQSIINQPVHTSVSVTYMTYNNRDTTSDLALLFGQIELLATAIKRQFCSLFAVNYSRGSNIHWQGLFSCPTDSLELSPGFYPGPDLQCRLIQTCT